ncbi:hypothetical protein GCM10009789_11470 [Kribbella sancticallisti]|uniref:Integrase SAM-like N-terminal domain-containing protein n=1 Tax=Kribbella sancticallisti TaxID=460087 RepID=A0ABN2CNZ7_9ACTN
MARKPLELGTWGKIRTYVTHTNAKGKPDGYRAVTNYRDYNGRTRQVEAYGKSATAAGSNLVARLKERSQLTSSGLLTLSTRFNVAADLYIARLEEKVQADRYSPGTLYTYQLHLKNNILPRIGEICLVLQPEFVMCGVGA